jgi:hypothetical protein
MIMNRSPFFSPLNSQKVFAYISGFHGFEDATQLARGEVQI